MPLARPAPVTLGSMGTALLLLTTTACEPSRRDQCKSLVGAISPHVPALNSAIEDLSAVQGGDAAAKSLRSTAASSDRDVAALELTDEKLVTLAANYREQLGGIAAFAETLSTADGDPTKLHAAVVGTDAFVARQADILGELNGYCSAK